MALMPAALHAVSAHVESTWPDEGCGLIFRGADGSLRVQPMKNLYDQYHAKLPDRFPRTNRTAYFMNPLEFARAVDDASAMNERLICIFHSHAEVGSYFSQEDKDMAAPEGLELHPGVAYLVVAVDQRKTTNARLFRFENGDFPEIDLETLTK